MHSPKDPWLAVNLALLFPGLGHLYAGQFTTGLAFMGGQILLVAIASWSILAATGNTVVGLVLVLPILFVYVANLFEAYRAVRGRGILDAPNTASPAKSAWYAVFLSQLLPGLGHLYLNHLGLSMTLMVMTLLFLVLASQIPVFWGLLALVTAIASYQAYIQTPQSPSSPRSVIFGFIGVAVALRLSLSYFPTWLGQQIEPFIVPSESMLPTLVVGDRILVHKSTHYQPQRPDLVVFRAPQIDPTPRKVREKFYVKRVIGEPADRVEVSAGMVSINQVPLQETYLAEPPAYLWPAKTVPQNSYFVLGDNRNYSFDSHVWGFMPQKSILGKAYKIVWPPQRIRPL